MDSKIDTYRTGIVRVGRGCVHSTRPSDKPHPFPAPQMPGNRKIIKIANN